MRKSDQELEKLFAPELSKKLKTMGNQGYSIYTMAEKVGIAWPLLFAFSPKDKELKQTLTKANRVPQHSKGRRRAKRALERTGNLHTLQIQQVFLNDLANRGGFFEKVVDIAEAADPTTEEGREMILRLMKRGLLRDMLAKQSVTNVEMTHTSGDSELESMTPEELEAQILEYDQQLQSLRKQELEAQNPRNIDFEPVQQEPHGVAASESEGSQDPGEEAEPGQAEAAESERQTEGAL